MRQSLPGQDESIWIGTTKHTNYPELVRDIELYDVAVVGGGITGIVTAYRMQKAGLRVVLVGRGRIVEWTTGSTTAKLSAQHYLIYDYLIRRHSRPVAAAFAQANQRGIDAVERLSKELSIDCGFSRCDAYVYTQQAGKVDAIKAEVAAATSLGLPASFETTSDLPFPILAAIKFSDQAQFHPRKFLLALAEKFVAAGGVLYEQTEAIDITPGHPHVLTTKQGTLLAKSIVQASGEPFWGGEVLDGRMWMKMSYALAVTLRDEASYPNGMYITTDQPMRTIRSAPDGSGRVLLFGGEAMSIMRLRTTRTRTTARSSKTCPGASLSKRYCIVGLLAISCHTIACRTSVPCLTTRRYISRLAIGRGGWRGRCRQQRR